MRFRRILVYAALHDESGHALSHAAALARKSGARLTLLRVLERQPIHSRWRPAGSASSDLAAILESCQREVLEEEAQALRDEGLDVEVEVRWGAAWLEVIEHVLTDGHDLVVKAAEGSPESRGLLFGSTALHLIRKCPCPVWVVNGPSEIEAPRVLAAVDPEPGDVRRQVAQEVLALAGEVCGDDGRLHVVSAWHATGESLLRGRMKPVDLAAYVESVREDAASGLEEILEASGVRVRATHTHLLRGRPRVSIARFIRENDIDHLVMGSVGRTGVAGLIIGETAEALVRTVRCSVLVVKPPGFTSPVQPGANEDR